VNCVGGTTTGNSCTKVYTKSWDATDACGNHSGTVTQTITAVDTHAPTIGAALLPTTIDCTATPSFTTPTASDDCSGATVNCVGGTTTGNSCTKIYTKSWDATDACGNHSGTVTQTITAVDTHAPTIGAALLPTTIDCTATPVFTTPTASDDCSGATVNCVGGTTNGNSCTKIYTKSWDATDACGNHSGTVTQTITAVDTHAPTIGAALLPTTIDCTATPVFTTPTASDDCSGATVNCVGGTTNGNSCTKVYTKSWDATDACGNHSGTVTQTITAVDTHAPTIGAAPPPTTIDCTATPSFTTPTASDDCSGATVNCVGGTTNGNSCTKIYTKSWDATDACGNHSGTVTQTITAVDTHAPTIGAALLPTTIDCTATPVFTTPTASDDCSGATVNCVGGTTNGNSCTKTYTKSWDATDACGNHSGTVTQTITAVDTHAPTIGAALLPTTIDCTATPSFTTPTASDDCSSATVNCVGGTTNGNSCTKIYTKSWDATDACGNHSGTVTQTITAVDTHAPTIGAALPPTTIDCTATPAFTTPTASDDCSGATVNCISTVTTPNGCPGNYTITKKWDATDACGNHSATVTQVITVQDTQAPTIGNPGADATIECTATPPFAAPTATDACSGATVNCISTVTTPGGCPGKYTITKKWDASDACGNHSATVTQVITVQDTQPPTIGSAGPNNITIQSTATPSFTMPTATDACSGAPVNFISDVTTAVACPNKWTVTRTWDASDACNNHSVTRSQTITFSNVAPTATSVPATQPSVTYGAAILPITVTATDADSPGSSLAATATSYTKTGGGTYSGLMPGLSLQTTATTANSRSWSVTGCAYTDVGTYTQTITVTDDCGATTTTSFQIVVTPGFVNPVSDGYYTGPSFYWTTGPSSSTTTLTLSATIKNVLVNCGDIRTAKVSFYVDNGTTLIPINGAQNLPVGLVNPGDLSTGTANAIVQYNVGSSTVTQLLIAVRITGNYFGSADPAAESLVTIAIPTPGGLIVGGGKLCNEASAGYIKGAPSPENTCYSFSVQYNKSLTNTQGGVYLYVKSYNDRNGNNTYPTLHTYKIKSTAISGLVISTPTASFASKATVSEIVNGVEQSIEGNCQMQLDICDKDAPGGASCGGNDLVGVVVYRKAGGVWYANKWDGTQTVKWPVCDGTVCVTGTGTAGPITTTSPMARQTERELVAFNQLNLKAYPNPSENEFTLQVESDNIKDKISLKVFDMAGRTVQTFTGLVPGQTLRVGSNYVQGVYFIDMMQGDKHNQLKIVKQ
jgi:hypothetical protein